MANGNGVKVVTIGGGSSYTPELVEGLILRHDRLPVSELVLVDVPEGEEKLETVGALARRMVEHAGVPMRVATTLDRRRALEGADFVTTQIRVGVSRPASSTSASRSPTASWAKRPTAPAACSRPSAPSP